jgi:hypothetical protein
VKYRPLNSIELVGANKMRRALTERIVAALPGILGAVGISVYVTTPERVDEKPAPGSSTVPVTFQTTNFVVWGELLNEQDPDTSEQIALAHLKEAVRAATVQLTELEAQVAHRSEQRRKAKEERREAQVGDGQVAAVEPAAPGQNQDVPEVRGEDQGAAPPVPKPKASDS